jgi:lipopolysaccharide transport system permease protein
MREKEWLIRPQERLFSLKIKELIQFRYLLSQLVYRDLIASYKQTILGPAWLIVHPIITTFVFTLVFSRIIKVSTNGLPAPLFYLSGIICWNYFSECLIRTSTVFKDNVNIFGKVYFPRIIVPISLSISMFFRLLIHIVLLIVLTLIYQEQQYEIHLLRAITLIPLLIVMTAMLGVGLGLIVACLTLKYKDLNFVIVFGLQLLMYTTTIIFPLSAAPKNLIAFIQANPVTPIIEAFRHALFNAGNFEFQPLLYSVTCSMFSFSIGYIIFNRMERSFIDSI